MPRAKGAGRDRGKERHWRRMLREWRRSGLTGRDFCADRGLSEPSFYGWKREIARRNQEQAAARQSARRTHTSLLEGNGQPNKGKEAEPAFVRVNIDGNVPAMSAIELVLSSGRVLRVRSGVDVELLRQLVRLLEEPAC